MTTSWMKKIMLTSLVAVVVERFRLYSAFSVVALTVVVELHVASAATTLIIVC